MITGGSERGLPAGSASSSGGVEGPQGRGSTGEAREPGERDLGAARDPGGQAAERASQVESRSPQDAVDPQSDQWLVGRARMGDADAWEVLLRRHRDRIYRIALRMTGDPHDAEDVTQEVTVQLLTALAGFSGTSSFTTWLYRIVINRSLNHQRGRSRYSTRPLDESDGPVVSGPEQTVLDRAKVAATGVSLAALPSTLRTALVLHEMEGLSYQEVAAILHTSESTVRGRIHRARRTLLSQLRDWS